MGRLPLHVLTGFLGSGKTTLLNRLLRAPGLADTAVLVNEIGAVSIDHHLIERMEQGAAVDVVVLDGGCTCCVVRGDLKAALRELYRRRAEGSVPAFARVVLETTGLADPAPVLFTLVGDPLLRHKFKAGLVIATVDALHAPAQWSRFAELRKQIVLADRLVITKADLVGAGAIEDITTALRRLNPTATICDARVSDVGCLLDGASAKSWSEVVTKHAGVAAGFGAPDTQPKADHSHGIHALTVVLDRPLAWSAFSVWLSLLLHAHGERIMRVKALLDLREWPTPVVLDAVHHLIHPPIHLRAWPPGARTSRLVVIAQDLASERIEASLRRFLAAEDAGTDLPWVATARS
jgi:G3E family GTPase